MKKIPLIAVFVFVIFLAISQLKNIDANLTANDKEVFSIIKVLPKEFPNVSVIFKAEDKFGNPIWNLPKTDLTVTENGESCEIVSLNPISKKLPISISLVVDRSGSMEFDSHDLGLLDSLPYDDEGNYIFPEGYESPLEKAKKSVVQFMKSFDCNKDYFSLVGFSTRVKELIPPTKTTTEIVATVKKMVPDSSTALYDAIYEGINQANKAEGIKAVVVLTDGMDNSSTQTCNDAIDFANKTTIPVFIIGLGDVDQDTLELICNETHGEFFYAKSSSTLDDIYAKISKKIQSYYDLVYTSENLSSTDTSSDIQIQLKFNNKLLETGQNLHLPDEVISYLKEQEKNAQYMLFGGIGGAVLLLGGVLYFWKKKTKIPALKVVKVYPNPVKDIVKIECSQASGNMSIVNKNGEIVYSAEITGQVSEVNMSNFSNGFYTVVIQQEGAKSNAVKFLKI